MATEKHEALTPATTGMILKTVQGAGHTHSHVLHDSLHPTGKPVETESVRAAGFRGEGRERRWGPAKGTGFLSEMMEMF